MAYCLRTPVKCENRDFMRTCDIMTIMIRALDNTSKLLQFQNNSESFFFHVILPTHCLNTIIRIWNTPETFTLTPRIKWVVWRSAWGDIMHTRGCRPRQLLVYSVICQNVTSRFKGERMYIVQNWQKNTTNCAQATLRTHWVLLNACDLNNKKW